MKNKKDGCVKRVTIVWSLCACLAGPAALGQGLISNGTFDSDASGWTAQNIASLGGYIGSKGNPGGYFMLDSIPSLDTDPTLSQTINGLITSATYRISGEFRMERDWDINSPVYCFGVSLNGVNVFEGMRSTDWNQWNTFDVTYTASSTSVLLAIAAQRNGTGVTYGIDNISMQQVPEPAVTSLLTVGALFLMRMRHKGDTAAPLLSGTATASSDGEYGNEPGCTGEVIDGVIATPEDFSNRWHSALDQPHPHWVEVHLAKPAKRSARW